MLLRNFGKLIRGKSTPFQVFSAAVLGSALAYLPGLSSAPGLYLALGLALFVLNTNLFIAGLVAIPAKLAALAGIDLSMRVGESLLHGPAQGLFKQLVNAPVLHYFGLQRYLVTGSLAMGLALGIVLGVLLVILLKRVRRTLAALELKNEKYQALSSKRGARFASWVLLGGKSKLSYEELNQRNIGNPFRIVGLLVVVLVAGGLFLAQRAAGSPYVAQALQTELARANGAEVDLGGFKLDLGAARLRLANLVVVDPEDLMADLLRGVEFDADVNSGQFLRGRFVVDHLTIRDATTGARREQPGQRVGPPPASTEPSGPIVDVSEVTLESVLKDAERIQQQLEKVQQWLKRLSPAKPEGAAGGEPEGSLHDRLRTLAKELGYQNLVAEHLLDGLPLIEIKELNIAGFHLPGLSDQEFTLVAQNLSSAPASLAAAPLIQLASKDKKLRLDLSLGSGLSAPQSGLPGRISLAIDDLDVDSLAKHLTVRGEQPLSGGRMQVRLDGGFSPSNGRIDLPLSIELEDSNINVPGVGRTSVAHFALPIGLRGPLDRLRVSLDDKQLVDALVAAGKAEFANKVKAELGQRFQDAKADARQALEARFGPQLGQLGIDLDQLQNIENLQDVTDIQKLVEAQAAQKLAETQQKLAAEAQQKLEQTAQDALQKAAADALQGQGLDKATEGAKDQLKKGLGDLLKKKP